MFSVLLDILVHKNISHSGGKSPIMGRFFETAVKLWEES
jgi:hypothetical protein